MTGTGEILHRGTKVFWKVRSTCDVVLIKHAAFDMVEVVCYDPVRGREAARLYVKHSVLADRISQKQFELKLRIAAQNKDQQSDGTASVSSGSEISTIETVNYICDRLHVQSYEPKSRVFQIELVEYLPTDEIPSEKEQLLFNRPAALIPVDIMLMPNKTVTINHTNTHPNNDINKSTEPIAVPTSTHRAELSVDIPPAPVDTDAASSTPKTPKTPKTPVPAIRLELLAHNDDMFEFNVESTAPNTLHTTSTNNTSNPTNTINTDTNNTTDTTLPASTLATIALSQELARPVTAHTADSVEADFNIHHGRRAQTHKPFTPKSHHHHSHHLGHAHNTTTNNNTNNSHTTTSGSASTVTSPVVSPRPQAGSAYAKQITPRKGGGHISVLQATHNTHNSHVAEVRHAKQHVHTNHSIVSHYSVGSSHLAPIPVPDQLTKITTHPTLPPHRNLTAHQEPMTPNGDPEYKYHNKKKATIGTSTISNSIATFTNAMYSMFSSSSDTKVACANPHTDDIHILNTHNCVEHIKPGTVVNYNTTNISSNSSSSSSGSGGAMSIPKHMRLNGV